VQKKLYEVYINHAKGNIEKLVTQTPLLLKAKQQTDLYKMELDLEKTAEIVKTLLHIAFFLVSFIVSNVVTKAVVWSSASKYNL
jgi:hypothetical protein